MVFTEYSKHPFVFRHFSMFKQIADWLGRYQIAIIVFMLVMGLLFPELFSALRPLNTLFLQTIMFTTGLRLEISECINEFKDWKTLLLSNGMMLVGLPFLASIPLALFAPEWSLPFLIAASSPTGLTAPAVVALLGGRASLALLMALVTNILAPFTIPLMLKMLLGRSVDISLPSMMLQIANVIIIPLGLALIIQYHMGLERVRKYDAPFRILGTLAFGLVVSAVASSSNRSGSSKFLEQIGGDGFIIAILMMVFWLGIAWLSTSLLKWRTKTDKLTIAFCLIYMNYTLSIWIADTFFPKNNTGPKLVLIVILIMALLPLFKIGFPQANEARPGIANRLKSLIRKQT
jgi:BASS family bile acid:Na+ symporter